MEAIQVWTSLIEAAGGSQWQHPKTMHLKGSAHFTPFGWTDDAHYRYFSHYEWYCQFPLEREQSLGQMRLEVGEEEDFFLKYVTSETDSQMFLSDLAKAYFDYFKYQHDGAFHSIRRANLPGFSMRLLTEDVVEKYHCYFLQITDPDNNQMLFGIDQYHFVIRYWGRSTAKGYQHCIYDDFRQVPGMTFIHPHKVKYYFDGIKWMDLKWEEVQVDQQIPEAIFTTIAN